MRDSVSGRAWWPVVLLFSAAVAGPYACGQDKGGGDEQAAVEGVLDQVGSGVVGPTLTRFAAAADALVSATADWRDSPGAEPGLLAAQTAWVDAMLVWQELEVMQIGPAGSSLTAVAGEDLRDEVYSWPTVNPCRIDQVTADEGWSDGGFFADNLVNVYGVDALEHLLYAGDDHACGDGDPLTTDGTWDALGPAEIEARRAAYAHVLSEEVARLAATLNDRWAPAGGDFAGHLRLGAGTPYASQTEALNAVFDALFYLELSTKDRKIAVPLGLADCPNATCPDDVELPSAKLGGAAIAANLRGFKALFTGGDGPGLGGLLAAQGHESLEQSLLKELDEALALAEAGDPDLAARVEGDTSGVQELYDEVKDVTDLLKGPVATILTLQIPSEAAGDAD